MKILQGVWKNFSWSTLLRNVEQVIIRYVHIVTLLRVQEIIDLTPESVRTSKPYTVELLGKGTKKKNCSNRGRNYAIINGIHGGTEP